MATGDNTTTSAVGRWEVVCSRADDGTAARELAQAFWYPSYLLLRSVGIDSLEAGLRVERALGWLAAEPPALAEGLTLRETRLEATKRALGGSVELDARSALDLRRAERQFGGS
jgi:hypothetical protein